MRGLIALGLVLSSAGLCLAAKEQKPATIPDLIGQLSSNDSLTRQRAAKQLGNLGLAARDAVPVLGKLLHDAYPDVRSSAAKALGQIGTPAVPTLIEALKDPEIKNHARIANALAWIGPLAKEAVPVLADLLKSNWEPARLEALVALGEIGSESQSALPAVVRVLADPSERVREQALGTLKQIGPAAIPILKEALRDKSLTLRLWAMHALALYGRESKKTIPVLRDALKDTDPRIRAQAAASLGSMGKDAQDAIPNLLDALQDKKLSVQVQAALAVVGMAMKGIPGLLEKIRIADRKARWAEPVILKQFGKTTAENVKVLAGRLQDKDANIRAQALMALTVFGMAARPAVPALNKALQDENDSIRYMAAVVLLGIDPNNKEALKAATNTAGAVPALRFAAQRQRVRQIDAVLEDPVLQEQYDRIISFYIIVTATRGAGVHTPDISSLPPEAVPALVRGLNLVATYQLGFC
ncbi:MAG TPA: HEAT repeat domain-containing protein [Gemmataceae bacterium]|nr:HEAT repeat domain-containing protein [Gemmataceae bacterium]